MNQYYSPGKPCLKRLGFPEPTLPVTHMWSSFEIPTTLLSEVVSYHADPFPKLVMLFILFSYLPQMTEISPDSKLLMSSQNVYPIDCQSFINILTHKYFNPLK